ncbi:MAG TPA: type II toxin-antitoxin system HicB family antitoxin [Solirubrobacteraceae bacterium]|nr:type II toxin-antitoxin system HicB family antitoxin [Solirubrobacteraceae bacterium]
MTQTVHVRVRFEDQAFWATVDEYPGVFATGDTLDELRESLEEGVSLVLDEAGAGEQQVRLSPLPDDSVTTVATSELTLV